MKKEKEELTTKNLLKKKQERLFNTPTNHPSTRPENHYPSSSFLVLVFVGPFSYNGSFTLIHSLKNPKKCYKPHSTSSSSPSPSPSCPKMGIIFFIDSPPTFPSIYFTVQRVW